MENTLTHDIEKLSSRESEVLVLLCKGFTRDLIAETMGISKLTYDSYRKSIRGKLDIKNQSDWAKVLYRNSQEI